jgi:hypothetical protein
MNLESHPGQPPKPSIPNNYVVISVESQKGGVGKTTAALNVARLLCENERYRVLLFDLDLAGTEAATIESAPLWREGAHVVTFEIREEKEGKVRIVPSSNLVELYDEYMSGRSIPKFEWKSQTANLPKVHILDPEKINILSSSLVSARNGHRTHLHGPQVLFDEAHAAWFLDMVRGIIDRALEGIGQNHLAVVIDNSPGFSGLRPNVEEWLTDLGSDRGKFLFVASADGQDIRACIQAIGCVEDILKTKLEAGWHFHRASRGDDNDDQKTADWYAKADKAKQRFFMRLVEQNTRLAKNVRQKSIFPAEPSSRPSLLEWYLETVPDENQNSERASSAWAIIHNRVPPVLMRQELISNLRIMIPDVQGEGAKPIVARCRREIRQRLVANTPGFDLQFVDIDLLQKDTDPAQRKPTTEAEAEHLGHRDIRSGRELLLYSNCSGRLTVSSISFCI